MTEVKLQCSDSHERTEQVSVSPPLSPHLRIELSFENVCLDKRDVHYLTGHQARQLIKALVDSLH